MVPAVWKLCRASGYFYTEEVKFILALCSTEQLSSEWMGPCLQRCVEILCDTSKPSTREVISNISNLEIHVFCSTATMIITWGITEWILFLSMEQYTLNICKSSVLLSTSDHFLHTHPSELIPLLSVWFHIKCTPCLLSWCERALHRNQLRCSLPPVNVIPALIVFPRQYLCHLFLQRTNSKHVCLWSSVPGRTVIYSLNRAFVLAGKKISEVPGRDQVSVIPWARRRLSGSPGGKNSWEENNVSMWMPVKCVSWWESLFSVRSRHNKQWLKAYKETMMVKM